MQELIWEEIQMISGGKDGRRYDVVPGAQSEWGKLANDIFNTCGEAGSALGIAIWDWTH